MCPDISPLIACPSLLGASALLPNTNKRGRRGEETAEGHEGRGEEAASPSPVNRLYRFNKD